MSRGCPRWRSPRLSKPVSHKKKKKSSEDGSTLSKTSEWEEQQRPPDLPMFVSFLLLCSAARSWMAKCVWAIRECVCRALPLWSCAALHAVLWSCQQCSATSTATTPVTWCEKVTGQQLSSWPGAAAYSLYALDNPPLTFRTDRRMMSPAVHASGFFFKLPLGAVACLVSERQPVWLSHEVSRVCIPDNNSLKPVGPKQDWDFKENLEVMTHFPTIRHLPGNKWFIQLLNSSLSLELTSALSPS